MWLISGVMLTIPFRGDPQKKQTFDPRSGEAVHEPSGREGARLTLLRCNNAPHIFQQNEQVHRVGRGRDEVEFFLETLSGLLILRMHREGADAGNVGRLQGALHRVPQKRLPDALALRA